MTFTLTDSLKKITLMKVSETRRSPPGQNWPKLTTTTRSRSPLLSPAQLMWLWGNMNEGWGHRRTSTNRKPAEAADNYFVELLSIFYRLVQYGCSPVCVRRGPIFGILMWVITSLSLPFWRPSTRPYHLLFIDFFWSTYLLIAKAETLKCGRRDTLRPSEHH